MQYTQSDSHSTHAGTGNNYHDDSKPIPTAVSADDMNMVVWSLMEVVKNQGLAPVDFDKDDPASYQVLLNSIKRQSGRGELFLHLGDTAPQGAFIPAGVVLDRVIYGDLWAHVSDPANGFTIVDDAEWLSGRYGCYSSGDGSTTFRSPELRAEHLRFADLGRGINVNLDVGQWLDDQMPEHNHTPVLVQTGSAIQVHRAGVDQGSVNGGVQPRAIVVCPCIWY